MSRSLIPDACRFAAPLVMPSVAACLAIAGQNIALEIRFDGEATLRCNRSPDELPNSLIRVSEGAAPKHWCHRAILRRAQDWRTLGFGRATRARNRTSEGRAPFWRKKA